jgi:hypothetical protein
MPTINKNNGIEMADIAKINEQDVPSTSGGTATTTPTLSTPSDIYGTNQTITITNYGSAYTDPHVSASVFIGGTEIVSNDNITNTNGVLSWSDTNTSTSTRTIKVRVQEFGDFVQSAEATATYSKLTATFRYFRCRGVDSSGNNSSAHLGIRDWRYTSSSVDYPSDMTADNLPSPFVASAGHTYSSTYAPFKAFDSSTSTWWWSLTTSSANNYLDIDMGASYTFDGGTIRFYSGSSARYVTISGSTDGTNYTVINDTLEMDLTNSDMTIL